MNDWIVVVKYQGTNVIKRVFVEDIAYEDEAERLALLKLGVSSEDHQIRAEIIHERVSIENPANNTKELYEEAVVELTATQRKLKEAEDLSDANLKRAEKAETERDRSIEIIALTLSDVWILDGTLKRIHKRIEKYRPKER